VLSFLAIPALVLTAIFAPDWSAYIWVVGLAYLAWSCARVRSLMAVLGVLFLFAFCAAMVLATSARSHLVMTLIEPAVCSAQQELTVTTTTHSPRPGETHWSFNFYCESVEAAETEEPIAVDGSVLLYTFLLPLAYTTALWLFFCVLRFLIGTIRRETRPAAEPPTP